MPEGTKPDNSFHPMERVVLSIETATRTSQESAKENRKVLLTAAALVAVILFALTVATWVSVISIGKLGDPGITIDQAVASGHAVVVEYEDGAKGVKWMPGPDTYTKEIEDQAEELEALRTNLGLAQSEMSQQDAKMRELEHAAGVAEAELADLRQALAAENAENNKAQEELAALRRAIGDTAAKIKYEDLPIGARNIDLLENLEDAAKDGAEVEEVVKEEPKKEKKYFFRFWKNKKKE